MSFCQSLVNSFCSDESCRLNEMHEYDVTVSSVEMIEVILESCSTLWAYQNIHPNSNSVDENNYFHGIFFPSVMFLSFLPSEYVGIHI